MAKNNAYKKKIGIIGCGTLTTEFYSKVFPNISTASVEYVCDINKSLSTLASKIFNAASASIEELVENSELVIIATPPQTHYELVKKSLKPNNYVVCEKPFMVNTKDAEDVISISENIGSSLYVAHMRRFYPSVQIARKLFATGILGKLLKIGIYEGNRFKYKSVSNYVANDKTGGVLFDSGSHCLDMALYIAHLTDSKIKIKVANVQKDQEEPSHDIHSCFTIKSNTSEIKCELLCSRVKFLSNKITFIFENGQIDVPISLENYIRVSGPDGITIINSPDQLKNLTQVYCKQYKSVINQNNDQMIEAKQFLNLTTLLETIYNHESRLINE